jgi:hypothetical protein
METPIQHKVQEFQQDMFFLEREDVMIMLLCYPILTMIHWDFKHVLMNVIEDLDVMVFLLWDKLLAVLQYIKDVLIHEQAVKLELYPLKHVQDTSHTGKHHRSRPQLLSILV